jgi:hypothetical protein
MESAEEWITAAEAARLLKPVFGNSEYAATITICKRAHGGLIRARAEQFMMDKTVRKNIAVPKDFWWAEGNISLIQKLDDWRFRDVDKSRDSPAGFRRLVFACRHRQNDSRNLGACCRRSCPRPGERWSAESRLVGRFMDRNVPTTVRGGFKAQDTGRH